MVAPVQLTVVLPCYNAAPFVTRAVASVQAQGLANWELIAVDDGSTDETLAVLQGLAEADPRIHVLSEEDNRGPGAARNRAIARARGTWIAPIDADDAWAPDRAGRLIAMGETEAADLVADNLQLFDHHAAVETGPLLPPGFGSRELTAADVLAAESRIEGPRWGFLKPMVRRAVLERTGLAYAEDLRLAEDLLLLCGLLLSGAKGVLVDAPLYIYTAQRGASSGERSPHSRSPRDPADRLRCAERLMARYGATASPEDRAVLRCFLDAMRAVDAGASLTRLRGEGRPLAALAYAAARPRAAWRYVATSPTWRKLVGHGR